MRTARQRTTTLGIAALTLFLGGLGALGGDGRGHIYVAHISGDLCPAGAAFVRYAINTAERHHAQALIFEIDCDSGAFRDATKAEDAIASAHVLW